jgi:hypothetical protein
MSRIAGVNDMNLHLLFGFRLPIYARRPTRNGLADLEV